MFRFFVSPEQTFEGKQITISGEDVLHISRSLRLKPGDKIIICDGQGTDYLVELVELNSDRVLCEVRESYKSKGEPEVKVTLFQGIPKSDKMDLIVQKSTELGISHIIPIETKRTIVKLNDQKSIRKLGRWKKIAEEAAKQSDRGKIPQIGPIFSWEDTLNFLEDEDFDLLLVPWEEADNLSIKYTLTRWKAENGRTPLKIGYLIGPEGGFEKDEIIDLVDLGAVPITLGPRILRTETAGFVTLAVLMYEFNGMEGCDN